MHYGTLVPGTKVLGLELSLPGAKVPCNFLSRERKFHGTFAATVSVRWFCLFILSSCKHSSFCSCTCHNCAFTVMLKNVLRTNRLDWLIDWMTDGIDNAHHFLHDSAQHSPTMWQTQPAGESSTPLARSFWQPHGNMLQDIIRLLLYHVWCYLFNTRRE